MTAGSTIVRLEAWDLRFPLPGGAGSDARHPDPVYSLATCRLRTADGTEGTGFTLTLGEGNDLVARAVAAYATRLVGDDLCRITARLGDWWARMADLSQLRWLGPHKGVVHLGLAAVCGAVVDAWARRAGRPLWRLLVDAGPDELAAMVDPRTLGGLGDPAGWAALAPPADPSAVAAVVTDGQRAYDTTVGWLGYPLEGLVERAAGAVAAGFDAVKVKIGSPTLAEDVARLEAVREVIGPGRALMVDANQAYDPPTAIAVGRVLADLGVTWFEEPVHPDDLVGYRRVAEAIAPVAVAGGEHLPNQVAFASFLATGALGVAQPDVVRLGGLPEFLGVALTAAHHGVPVAPHAGDMGQIHQHLAPFVHLRLGLPVVPLEHIGHLAHVFAEPARIVDGAYRLPETPGASTALVPDAYGAGTCVAVVEDRP